MTGAVVAALAVAAVTRRCIPFFARVHSESMRPTLSPGDLLVVTRPFRDNLFRRGDIIVFQGGPRHGHLQVKRVIGLPGERVQIDQRTIRIDGDPLTAPYGMLRGTYRGVFDVPEDAFFVVGDNDESSFDSRSWDDPFVARRHVRGVVRTAMRRPGRREPRMG